MIASHPRCHFGLCLDSALHNHVLCGRLTPHTLSRAGAGVFSCWLSQSMAPLLSPCCLLEGPWDFFHACILHTLVCPLVCLTASFFLNPAYLRTAFPIFPEWGLALFWKDIFFLSPSPMHTPTLSPHRLLSGLLDKALQ